MDGVRVVKATVCPINVVAKTAAEVTNRARRIAELLFKPSAEYLTDEAFTPTFRKLRSASLGSFARFRVLVLSRAARQQPPSAGGKPVAGLPKCYSLEKPLLLGSWALWRDQGFNATPMDARIHVTRKGRED